MWKDIAIMAAFWMMVLAPCLVAINVGGSGAEDEDGYESGALRAQQDLGR